MSWVGGVSNLILGSASTVKCLATDFFFIRESLPRMPYITNDCRFGVPVYGAVVGEPCYI